jgi:hypothetical protein
MIEQYLAWAGFTSSGPPDPMVKGGQDVLSTPGTIEWTVPVGVTSISVAVISAGLRGRVQSAAAADAGRGGCVRWKNDIPVTPGDKYTLVIGSGGVAQSLPMGTAGTYQTDYASSAFGVIAGVQAAESTTIDSVVGGSNSANGASGGGSSGDVKGGDSGTFGGSGSGILGGGCSPLGVRVTSSTIVGANYGGGGGAQLRSSGNRLSGKGGDGCIRIMWGNGRAYPSTNIADRV